MRIDTEDIEHIVGGDLFDQRGQTRDIPVGVIEHTALDELLDTRAEERDGHDRHQDGGRDKERFERQLDREEADQYEDDRQYNDRRQDAQPYKAYALALLGVRDNGLIEEDDLGALTEYRKEGGEAQREHRAF